MELVPSFIQVSTTLITLERSLHNLLWMCMLACEEHSARYMFQNCKLGCDFKLNCICPVLYERKVYVDGKLRGMWVNVCH